jgi:hypothetical protein
MIPGPARLARVLVGKVVATFRVVPEEGRGPALEAVDRFLAAPAPAAFLAATRVLRSLRQRALIEGSAGATVRRSVAEAALSLRRILPPALMDRITTDLPIDARAGQRLQALAALATAYEELSSRVAADSDEMRRRLRAGAPRRTNQRR